MTHSAEFGEQLDGPKAIVAVQVDELYNEARQLAQLLVGGRDELVELALHRVTGDMSALIEGAGGLVMRREIGVNDFEDIRIDGCYITSGDGRMIGIARTTAEDEDRYVTLEPKNFVDHPRFEYAFVPLKVTAAGHDMIDRHLLEHDQTDAIMRRVLGAGGTDE